jgi:hypothetical protein
VPSSEKFKCGHGECVKRIYVYTVHGAWRMHKTNLCVQGENGNSSSIGDTHHE